MTFILIVSDLVGLPRAIEIDTKDIEEALTQCVDIINDNAETTIHLIIDKSTSEILRVYRERNGGPFRTHDSAYRKIGLQTGQLFYETDESTTED